jgi:hypothetical protein
MEETAVYMTTPDKNGTPTLPKRAAPKGMQPRTWLERTLRVGYFACYGGGQETSGTLLGFYSARAILNIRGARTLISWDRMCLAELVED